MSSNYRNSESARLGREEDHARYREEGVPWFMAIISLIIIIAMPPLLVKGSIELFQIIKEVAGWGGIFLPFFFIGLALFLDRLLLARKHIRVARMMWQG